MSWTTTTKALAKQLPNFENRLEQDRLATAIEHALTEGRHIAAQAGTGTGKTATYLSAAYDFAVRTRRPVVVATYTKVLQGQLAEKDLPLFQKIYPEMKFAVVKGRGSYACQARLNGPEVDQVSNIEAIRAELDENETHSGDLDSFKVEIRQGDRSKLGVGVDECPGRTECFAGETRYLTFDGVRTLAETAGTTQRILTDLGVWRDAEIKSFGQRRLWKVTLRRNKRTKVIYATEGHRWFRQTLHDGVRSRRGELTTAELRPGHVLTKMFPHTNIPRATPSQFGIAHGVVYGDGSLHRRGAKVQLWGEKDAQLVRYFAESVMHPVKTDNENGVEVFGLPSYFKRLPDVNESPSYLYGWLAGYFAADGNVTKQGQAILSSANRDNLEFVRLVAHRLGIGTYGTYSKTRLGKGQEPTELHSVQFLNSTLRSNFFLIADHRVRYDAAVERGNAEQVRWVVDSVEQTDRVDEVYCAVVPVTQSFTLEDNILVGNCPFGDVCYAERAKAQAQDADIVVANHAVLMQDLKIKLLTDGKSGMLPIYGAAIIDEAHKFEGVATDALGEEFSQRKLERFADDAATFLRDPKANVELRAAASALFVKLDEVMGKRENTVRLTDELLADLGDELVNLLKATQALHETIKRVRPEDDTQSLNRKRMMRRSAGQVSRLTQVIMAGSDEIVRWGEREVRKYRGKDETTVTLAYGPLHVGEYLHNNIWANVPSALVSATLATDEGFGYITGRLGMQDYTGFDAGSPFDYPNQAMLYTPLSAPRGNFPDPREDQKSWQARVAAESGELIKAAGGRTLVLCTSRRSMNDLYEALQPTLRAMGVTVLKQGGDVPNGQLAEQFKADETSVLFGLESFMTGADFQGDCCRLVIIDKMMFTPPSDVMFAARAELIDAAKTSWNTGSFMLLSVPNMILTLLQAFGRAIRTKTDRAAVVIFDPRINSKAYGRGVLRAMPPARQVNDLNSVKAFLQSI